MAAYLMAFAEKRGFPAKQDEAGNVLTVSLLLWVWNKLLRLFCQAHMDMVCEKNAGTVHDFEKDPIIPYIEGEWVKAKGTTLGADDGIGMAAQLALLASEDIKHGPLECLFTVNEECGLTGAFALKPGFFKGRILLNLDSEDEGELFIGCAGGMDTVVEMPIEMEESGTGTFAVKITVKGNRRTFGDVL